MGNRRASPNQLSLFAADQGGAPFEACAPSGPPLAAEASEQLLLFEGKTPLVSEVRAAFFDGDYRSAQGAYEHLRRTYPEDASVSFFEFLPGIPGDFWTARLGPEERLAVWRTISRRYPAASRPYRAAREGFFRRFLRLEAPREVVLKNPWVACDVANHLLSEGDWRGEREFVRDLLLAGEELKPMAFDDESVSDVLGEEGSPEWLASLGAIRLLWPRPPVENAHLAKLSAPLPEEDRERALDFWFCLCVSGMGKRLPEEARLDAHRRMKQLHRELHEEFMNGRSLGTA